MPTAPTDPDVVLAERIAQTATRVHPLVVTAVGTAHAPTVEEIGRLIAGVIEASRDPDYADLDYFDFPPLLVHVHRTARPWPSFQVLVPAAPVTFMPAAQEMDERTSG